MTLFMGLFFLTLSFFSFNIAISMEESGSLLLFLFSVILGGIGVSLIREWIKFGNTRG